MASFPPDLSSSGELPHLPDTADILREDSFDQFVYSRTRQAVGRGDRLALASCLETASG
jgi:hypothetical protein